MPFLFNQACFAGHFLFLISESKSGRLGLPKQVFGVASIATTTY